MKILYLLTLVSTLSFGTLYSTAHHKKSPPTKYLTGYHPISVPIAGFILCKPPSMWHNDSTDCARLPDNSVLTIYVPDSTAVPDGAY